MKAPHRRATVTHPRQGCLPAAFQVCLDAPILCTSSVCSRLPPPELLLRLQLGPRQPLLALPELL